MNSSSRLVLHFSITSIIFAGSTAYANDDLLTTGERLLPALATSGPSGGLNIPDGRTLPEGTVLLGFNNALEPQFHGYARADNYQFGIGFFKYFELTGRLVNYPLDHDGTIGLRDLSANVKFSVPKLLRYQPDIAIGINDIGGATATFRSTYIAVSEAFGPLRFTVGGAHGKPYLSQMFGGAEWRIGGTGFSALLERNNHAYHGGLRYGSRPIAAFGNAQILATAQRSVGGHSPDGEKFARSSLGINLVIPFGQNERSAHRFAPAPEPIWAQPVKATEPARLPQAVAQTEPPIPAGEPMSKAHATTDTPAPEKAPQLLQTLKTKLAKAGLERLRIGTSGDTLIVEFENHRYNQNEVDAIGIVLGLGATHAPQGIRQIAAVAKKANSALYMITVEQAAYSQFLRDGDGGKVKPMLRFQYRPSYDHNVQWLDVDDSPHGLSRIRIDPILMKFVGTELGVFDYALAANVQGIVPLWKGAELSTSYIVRLGESDDVAHGLFAYAKQPAGLKAAVVSQSFWLSDHALNVTSVGKFMYNGRGVQNETVFFVPGRDDQIRLQYTYLRHPDQPKILPYSWTYQPLYGETKAGSASYLWNYQPLDISVETSYNKYVGKDQGLTVQANRWFGDLQAQIFIRRSNLETRVGFGLAFPLTPRVGMHPGLTHVEGSGSFPLRLETKLAQKGECNCIRNGVVQEMSLVYSSRSNLLNQGRIGGDYLLSQLQLMRQAAMMYVVLMP